MTNKAERALALCHHPIVWERNYIFKINKIIAKREEESRDVGITSRRRHYLL